jgi:hypothetical protein
MLGQQFPYDQLGCGIAQSNLLTVLSNFSIDDAGTWQWTSAELDGLGRTVSVEKPDNTYIFNDERNDARSRDGQLQLQSE